MYQVGVLSAQVFNFELQSHDLLGNANDNGPSGVWMFDSNVFFWSPKIMIRAKNDRRRRNIYVDINVKKEE